MIVTITIITYLFQRIKKSHNNNMCSPRQGTTSNISKVDQNHYWLHKICLSIWSPNQFIKTTNSFADHSVQFYHNI